MEDLNLHFTGDFHAITSANNLLAAMLDNHIQQGNALGIDPKQITWRRCVDMNDRQLRNIVDGLGGRMQGVPREDGFDITVASEVMAILCLASDLEDLKKRFGDILVAYSYDSKPILKNVSVTIPDKTTTAIVGPSGSGKTTLCNLIARFWDVDHGSIRIGDADVREYTLESLMDQISMVFQKSISLQIPLKQH